MTRLPRLAFLCHGSTRQGLGHVTRSRAVAEAATAVADTHIFAVGDENAAALLAHGSTPFALHGRDDRAIDEIERFEPDAVFLDMVRLADADFGRVSSLAPTAALSPVFSHLGEVDAVFHRSRHHPAMNGSLRGRSVHAGLPYAVIRRECVRIGDASYAESLAPGRPLSVAVSMGGGDAENKTLRVLDTLRELPGPMLFWVLLGEGYGHSYDTLVESVRRDTRHEIILAKTTDSMWRVMSQCAVAVLASGTVTYEAAAAGLPSINLTDNPDHRFLIRELVEHGVAFDAGAPFEAGLSRTAELLAGFCQERAPLANARAATDGLIDGGGARRIVDAVLEMIGVGALRQGAAA